MLVESPRKKKKNPLLHFAGIVEGQLPKWQTNTYYYWPCQSYTDMIIHHPY